MLHWAHEEYTHGHMGCSSCQREIPPIECSGESLLISNNCFKEVNPNPILGAKRTVRCTRKRSGITKLSVFTRAVQVMKGKFPLSGSSVEQGNAGATLGGS